MSRNFQFALFVVGGAIVVTAIVAPDTLYTVVSGEPAGQMIDSDCPPDRAKQGRASCLGGPLAGGKVDDRINDAIRGFDN